MTPPHLTSRFHSALRGISGDVLPLAMAATFFAGAALAQQNRIDVVTPFAPELASYGRYDIGVRTVQATDRSRPDILNTKAGSATARYDRTLTLEVWYPAKLTTGQKTGEEYHTTTRDPAQPAILLGKAVRDAAPLTGEAAFPLVILSHGYPGNRFILGHLAENLASKGFVTVSIDHRDSTYDDLKAFPSTVYNRSFDQLFVLDEMERLTKSNSGSFLAGLADVSNTGIVGYSMGAYGVVNVIGAGYSKASETFPTSPPNGLLAGRGAATLARAKSADARIKAAIAIAPWGMNRGYWDEEGLKGIHTPVLFVAGSNDETSGYEKGTRAIYEGARNADRHLLTFLHASHNAAAPMPAPLESYQYSESLHMFPFVHYADQVWDSTRMNNILQHFATAYFEWHLKRDAAKTAYFDVVPIGKDAVFSADPSGKPDPNHTYWKGFKRGTAAGLILELAAPAK